MSDCAFETIVRTAYTHGFESIYALENVDPRSIRPFQAVSEVSTKPVKKPIVNINQEESRQLDFDFGLGYRSWIEPFFLYEPIQVLELNKFSEKILEQHHIKCLKDLLGYNYQVFISKGVGLGHVDEIQQKLNHYLKDKNPRKSTCMDLASFLRGLCGSFSKKKMFVFLQDYDLQELIPLSAADSMEVKRLTDSKRGEWVHEAFNHIVHESKFQFVQTKITEIALNFCLPWMEKRSGLASLYEILAWMEGFSLDACLTEKIFIFLSETYFSGDFPFNSIFPKVAEGVYAMDRHALSLYCQIQSQALTYFYKDTTSYVLDELILWMRREFAKQWLGLSDKHIQKVLVLSPAFYIWKNCKGFNEIKLA